MLKTLYLLKFEFTDGQSDDDFDHHFSHVLTDTPSLPTRERNMGHFVHLAPVQRAESFVIELKSIFVPSFLCHHVSYWNNNIRSLSENILPYFDTFDEPSWVDACEWGINSQGLVNIHIEISALVHRVVVNNLIREYISIDCFQNLFLVLWMAAKVIQKESAHFLTCVCSCELQQNEVTHNIFLGPFVFRVFVLLDHEI